MKQFKMIIPLMALMLGLVGAFAFTPAPQAGNMTQAWFSFTNALGNGDQTDPDNYQALPSEPVCGTGNRLCAVKALVDQSDPTHPDAQDIADISNNQKKQKS